MSLIPLSQTSLASASSTNTAGGCAGGLCSPAQALIDGVETEDNDLSFWESAIDPACNPIWFKSDWSSQGPMDLAGNFSILYGTIQLSNYIPEISVQKEGSSTPETPAITCKHDIAAENLNLHLNFYDCMFDTPVRNALSLTMTWKNLKKQKPSGCQVSLGEFVVQGVKAGTPLPAGVRASSSPSNEDGSSSRQSAKSSGLSVAWIVAISLLCVSGITVAILLIRRHNMEKRRQAAKFFMLNPSSHSRA